MDARHEVHRAGHLGRRGLHALLHQFERIFTTNYDLLLYWLLISSPKDYCDGFGTRTGELRFEKNYPYAHRYFYLHGALHLFTAQDDVRKVKVKRKSLRETLAETMAAHNYPLFISEGTHESKRRRIESSPYLRYALEQLCASRGTLVTFGLGFLGERPSHRWRALRCTRARACLRGRARRVAR